MSRVSCFSVDVLPGDSRVLVGIQWTTEGVTEARSALLSIADARKLGLFLMEKAAEIERGIERSDDELRAECERLNLKVPK